MKYLIIFVVVYLLWAWVGYKSFVYWWTTEFDFTTKDLGMAWGAGVILGPFAWLTGWLIHRPSNERVILKRKNLTTNNK